jgi:carboxylesterase type B
LYADFRQTIQTLLITRTPTRSLKPIPPPHRLTLAYHTADIQYLFPLYHGGPAPPSAIHQLNTLQEDLSDQLVAAWTNFAWTGNPNGLGNSPWPRHKGKSTSYYLS